MGDPPLILHSRHFSSQSPYFEETEAWIDGDRGHPKDPDFYERLMAQAAGWGAITYEQDWLIECFLGVRGLREAPGRARAWQEGIDAAARRHGRTLQWCMASPADFMQTVTLERVTSIRTSGDYRYIIGSGALWAWFFYTNALARALGLTPYKDVFFSSSEGEGWDGDPNCECEALVAALSSGPVGIGDRLGRTDRALVMRTCREDGMLVKPDVPVAALETCYRGHPNVEPHPLVGEAHTKHPAGLWHYVVGIHVWRGEEPIVYRFDLEDLGPLRPEGPLLAYDFRQRPRRAGRGERRRTPPGRSSSSPSPGTTASSVPSFRARSRSWETSPATSPQGTPACATCARPEAASSSRRSAARASASRSRAGRRAPRERHGLWTRTADDPSRCATRAVSFGFPSRSGIEAGSGSRSMPISAETISDRPPGSFHYREDLSASESLLPQVRIERCSPVRAPLSMTQLTALEPVFRRIEEAGDGLVRHHQAAIGEDHADRFRRRPRRTRTAPSAARSARR